VWSRMRDLFAVVIIILLTPSVAIADEPDPIVDAIVGIRQPESTIEAMLARLMPKATPEERVEKAVKACETSMYFAGTLKPGIGERLRSGARQTLAKGERIGLAVAAIWLIYCPSLYDRWVK